MNQAQSLGYFEYNDRQSNLLLEQDYVPVPCARNVCHRLSRGGKKVFKLYNQEPWYLSLFIIYPQMLTLLFEHRNSHCSSCLVGCQERTPFSQTFAAVRSRAGFESRKQIQLSLHLLGLNSVPHQMGLNIPVASGVGHGCTMYVLATKPCWTRAEKGLMQRKVI